jgi:hypothetical protein
MSTTPSSPPIYGEDVPAARDLATAIEEGDLAAVVKKSQGLDLRRLRTKHALSWEGKRLANPLGSAAAFGTTEMVRFLAERCGLDHRGENKRTPLMSAARHGRADNVALLLELGADSRAVDALGDSALAHAIYPDPASDSSTPERPRDSVACLDLLVARCDLARPNHKGRTPLALAAAKGSVLAAKAFARLLAPSLGLNVEADASALRACIAGAEHEHHSEALAIERLERMRPLALPEAWRQRRDVRRLPAASLMETALFLQLPRVALWLFEHGFFEPRDATRSLALLGPVALAATAPEATLRLAEALLPAANVREAIPLERSWPALKGCRSALLPLVARALRTEGSVYGSDHSLWAFADLLAAADPCAPGAKEVWACAAPGQLPRLNARVEAETLRQMVGAANLPADAVAEPAIAEPEPSRRGMRL